MFRELEGRVLLEHVYARNSAVVVRNNTISIKVTTPIIVHTQFSTTLRVFLT